MLGAPEPGAAPRFEFQKLHGMGDDLYAEVIGPDRLNSPCRVYAPVGSHEDLLPYLVRRLLENGANSSFVNRITDERVAPAELVADPTDTVRGFERAAHPRIPLPTALYGLERKNSMGVNLANDDGLRSLAQAMNSVALGFMNSVALGFDAQPLVPGANATGAWTDVRSPADRSQVIGRWQAADAATVEQALQNATRAQSEWDRLPAAGRAKIIEHAADLLESRIAEFMALCTREAGKTLADGVAEVREAVDFCRYYAQQARAQLGQPMALPGPTGESNTLHLHGRGVFVCISPWNFPLAIFMGQVVAALAAGNAVIAKPAEQTNLIAYRAVQVLHEAGIPTDVLQLLPGDGATVGAALTRDPRVAGVAFTGSTEVARLINRTLAARDAAIGVLVAETGGQNALIADSSALPEQLVKDAISGAFGSAGQRCSAARVLFVQSDIADKVIDMLGGAMQELVLGDPALLSTDIGPVIDAIGPVIDEEALGILQSHAARMDSEAKRKIAEVPAPAATAKGTFFAPRAYELKSLSQLTREIFDRSCMCCGTRQAISTT